jgi:hypothetical protein
MADWELKVIGVAPGIPSFDLRAVPGDQLEQAVDEDIKNFQEFMLSTVDSSSRLIPVETAILKTYLWWKTHQEFSAADTS